MDIPLCPMEHKPQILLTDPAALPLCQKQPERFAGAIAPDGETCTAWAQSLAPLPVGLMLDCPPVPDAEECGRPITTVYMKQCKQAFRPLLHDDAAF